MLSPNPFWRGARGHSPLFLHKCLCPQLFDGIVKSNNEVFKQLKLGSDHGIHELFVHGHYLKILKTERRLYTWRLFKAAPEQAVLIFFFLQQRRYIFSRNDVKMASTDINSVPKASISCIFRLFRRDFFWNNIKCKTNDRTCLFQCINICQVPRKTFEYSV